MEYVWPKNKEHNVPECRGSRPRLAGLFCSYPELAKNLKGWRDEC